MQLFFLFIHYSGYKLTSDFHYNERMSVYLWKGRTFFSRLIFVQILFCVLMIFRRQENAIPKIDAL